MHRRQLIFGTAAAAVLPSAVRAQQSSNWPTGVVRIVVGFPPGGGVDLVARTVGQKLSDLIGQQFIVDNRSGAGGTIAAEHVTRAASDGRTLLLASPAEVMSNPIAGQKIPYDPAKDLLPIMLVGETPLIIATHPATPGATLQEFIGYARRNPGRLSYCTPGAGSTQHFAGEALKARTGIFMVHIPYRGAAPAISDLLGGQVNVGIAGMPPVIPHVQSGKLRALAVTSTKRSPVLPGVPAVSELTGLSDYRFTNWMGLFAPAATPVAVAQAIERAVANALTDEGVQDKLQRAGVEPRGLGPVRFKAFLEEEIRAYTAIKERQKVSLE